MQRPWKRSAGSTSPIQPSSTDPSDSLRWCALSRGSGCEVVARLENRIPGIDFPGLRGVVLNRPHEAGEARTKPLRATDGNGDELVIRAPFWFVAPQNLRPGDEVRRPIPVPADQVVAALFGSLTNKTWVSTNQATTWVVDHDQVPTLGSWADEIGTDPWVRFLDLTIDDAEPRLVPATDRPAQQRLSDVWDELHEPNE